MRDDVATIKAGKPLLNTGNEINPIRDKIDGSVIGQITNCF